MLDPVNNQSGLTNKSLDYVSSQSIDIRAQSIDSVFFLSDTIIRPSILNKTQLDLTDKSVTLVDNQNEDEQLSLVVRS